MSEATATIDRPTTESSADPRAGMYIWQDLFTSDPKAAEAFYGALFGWTVKPMPFPGEMEGTYDILENKGAGFGGCMPLQPGMPGPRWVPYISVPNATGGGPEAVQAAVERAEAHGATILQPAAEIPTVGHFAIILDANGLTTNPFDPIPPADGMPPLPEGMPPHGGISWNEIWVNDLEAGKELYAAVYGWDLRDAGMGDVQYHICWSGERMQGGFGPTQGMMSPSTVFYVHVADLDATIAKVTELGGTTEGPTMDVPSVGRMQWCRDPQAAQFCLHENEKQG